MKAEQQVLPPESKGLAVFDPHRARLAEIEREEATLVFDYETKEGEKAARSHVHTLRLSKKPVDDVRKAEKAASLEYGRKVDSEGNAIIDALDRMIDRHVKPLAEKEQCETSRIEAHRLIIEYIRSIQGDATQPSEFLAAQCKILSAIVVDESLEEFRDEAAITYAERSTALQTAYQAAVKREQEETELAALRAEKVKRDQQDRDAQLAREAEDRGRIAAETAAKTQQVAIEAREKAASERAERAEAEARLAQERAARAAQDAREQAEREAKAVADKTALEQARREADIEHKKAINYEVLADLIEFAGVSEKTGKMVVAALFSGRVRHVKATY